VSMIIMAAVSIVLHLSKNRKIVFMSLLLSINALTYFMFTAQKVYPDEGENYFRARMALIFSRKLSIDNSVLSFFEWLNIGQIIAGYVMLVYLIFRLRNSINTK